MSKVKVFVSWSGERSRQVAELLRSWIPRVIQAVDPWMSDQDIRAGGRWLRAISSELQDSEFGLLCLTSDNKEAPWLQFEAGAISKVVLGTNVVPYLYGIEASELSGPLSQFQAVAADITGTRKLITTLNSSLNDTLKLNSSDLNLTFNIWWPQLESGLKAIAGPSHVSEKRDDGSILKEVLYLCRNIASQKGAPLPLSTRSSGDALVQSYFDLAKESPYEVQLVFEAENDTLLYDEVYEALKESGIALHLINQPIFEEGKATIPIKMIELSIVMEILSIRLVRATEFLTAKKKKVISRMILRRVQ